MPKIDAVKEPELFSGVNRSHHRRKGTPAAGCGPRKAPASGYALWQPKGFPSQVCVQGLQARMPTGRQRVVPGELCGSFYPLQELVPGPQ